MLKNLTTEARNPASESIDSLTPLEIVRLMNAEDAKIAPAVAAQAEAISLAIERIAERFQQGGRLIYMGAGTSGRLGVLDATECPPTFNAPLGQVIGLIAGGAKAVTQAVEGAEDRAELGVEDLKQANVSPRDTVVGIASSGRTPYVIAGLQFARQQGAFTVAVSCNANSEIADAAELAIAPLVGPEVLSGSTRLKAGTATKMVLNMLTTGAMVRIGKTYGNLMVDLRATNTKLRDRARRIVAAITDLDEPQSQQVLERAGGDLKTAVVLHRLEQLLPNEATSATAARRLAEAGGQLRLALQAIHAPAAPLSKAEGSRNVDRLVLGIDGGGTGTVAILARVMDGEPVVIGRGEAGASNPQVVGFQQAGDTLALAVKRAFAAALAEQRPVEAAVLALAGAGRDSDRRQLEQWAAAAGIARRFTQVHDALPLLAAGTPQGVGVALVAGTGSLAFGKNAAGETARAGGWGYLFGDEGSAYWIALAALRAVACAADGRGPATALSTLLLRELSIRQPEELVPAIYGGPADRTAIAGLARVVSSAADDGDAVAGQILNQAASCLAHMVASVAGKLRLSPTACPLALAGGVLTGSASFRQRLLDMLQREHQLRPAPVQVVEEPALGSLRLACELLLR